MPSREEIMRSLYGAYLLARLQPRGMHFFDLSFDGFLRSFGAALLIAPGFALLILLYHQPEYGALGPFMLAEFFAYGVSWIAFPLAMMLFVRAFDLGHAYVPFIVAYNWAQAIVIAVLLPVAAFSVSGMAGPDLSVFLRLLAFIASLAYVGWVAYVALQTRPWQAVLVVLLEFTVSYLIQLGKAALFQ